MILIKCFPLFGLGFVVLVSRAVFAQVEGFLQFRDGDWCAFGRAADMLVRVPNVTVMSRSIEGTKSQCRGRMAARHEPSIHIRLAMAKRAQSNEAIIKRCVDQMERLGLDRVSAEALIRQTKG